MVRFVTHLYVCFIRIFADPDENYARELMQLFTIGLARVRHAISLPNFDGFFSDQFLAGKYGW
jgi:uncharacterized protein (DUF1800 family)